MAVRGEMGMLGVSEQQKKALKAVEKKLVRQDMAARARQRWTMEKMANRQKFFRVCLWFEIHWLVKWLLTHYSPTYRADSVDNGIHVGGLHKNCFWQGW